VYSLIIECLLSVSGYRGTRDFRPPSARW